MTYNGKKYIIICHYWRLSFYIPIGVRIMENGSTLSELLKKTASDRQLSLRDFAKVLGVSHAYINKLMAGVDPRSQKLISPSIGVLLKIADALEIPCIEFLRQCGYLDK